MSTSERSMLMSADNSKSIMIVGAHAGDAELMAGGVAAKYAGMGHAVTLVYTTCLFYLSLLGRTIWPNRMSM